GYRESGFGREGGREGMWEYVKPGNRESGIGNRGAPKKSGAKKARPVARGGTPSIDRTPKLFIGGKQARPDSGYSRWIVGADGSQIAEVPEGNRKDIRNAVE